MIANYHTGPSSSSSCFSVTPLLRWHKRSRAGGELGLTVEVAEGPEDLKDFLDVLFHCLLACLSPWFLSRMIQLSIVSPLRLFNRKEDSAPDLHFITDCARNWKESANNCVLIKGTQSYILSIYIDKLLTFCSSGSDSGWGIIKTQHFICWKTKLIPKSRLCVQAHCHFGTTVLIIHWEKTNKITSYR